MSDFDLRSGPDEAPWQELLRQLRHQAKTQPQPFFYTRVQARLQARQAAPLAGLPTWVRRPAYAVLLSALILAVSGDAAALRATPPAGYPSALPGMPAR
jgi:hypothetical protein